MRITALLLLFCLANSSAYAWQQVIIREHGGPEVLEVVEHQSLPEPGPGEVRL